MGVSESLCFLIRMITPENQISTLDHSTSSVKLLKSKSYQQFSQVLPQLNGVRSGVALMNQ